MSSLKLVSSCFLLFAFLCIGKSSISQVDPYKSVSLVPPTAASLGKYADIPVNTHTGIPTISIPIYTAKLGSLEVPISLSYHAGGLKVMEVASWVGTGWSLNAGGVITRTVQGAPDEKLTSQTYVDQYYGHLSDGGYANYLWKQDPTTPVESLVYLNKIAAAAADGEPDFFFFNFGNYTGKFYFNENGKPVIVPEMDLKITYDYSPGLAKSIKSFIITTPDGTKYYFGITPETTDIDPVERSLAYGSGPIPYTSDLKSIVSWYLNKVESFDAIHEIKLTYDQERYSYPTLSLFPVPYSENLQQGASYTQIFVDGVKLKEIDFKNGKVNFNAGEVRADLNAYTPQGILDNPNTESTSLGDITISDNSANCKKFQFNYEYFTDDFSPMPGIDQFIAYSSDRKRLKLVSVQEKSCDNSLSVTPYFFDYYDEFVPRRLSFKQDYWGFYNGANNLTTMIPTITEFTNITSGAGWRDVIGADRESHWPEMRGGALKKITYPTGGFAEYEIEPNDTWVSSLQWSDLLRDQFSVGYGNTSETKTKTVAFLNRPYKFVLNNSNGGGLAAISVAYQSGTNFLTLSAEPGHSNTITVLMPEGSHLVTLSKNGFGVPASASGADITIDEKVPSTYSRNEMVGGLRVKKTILHDAVNESQNIETNYSYVDDNGKTTGNLYSRPTFVQVLKNSGARFGYRPFDYLTIGGVARAFDYDFSSEVTAEMPYFSGGGGDRKALMSPSPLLAMSTTQGNHIGYNEVRISKIDNGYSIYRFYGSDIWDQNNKEVSNRIYDRSAFPDAPEYPEAPLPFEFKRGNLKYEGHFSQSGKLLKEVTYYPTYTNSTETTNGIRVYTEFRCAAFSTITEYELKSSKKTQEIVEEQIYDPHSNTYLSNVKTLIYGSPNHNEVTDVQVSNSKNQLLSTKTKYAFDYIPVNCVQANNCKSTFDNFMTSRYLQLQLDLSNCTQGDDNCIKIKKAEYYLSVMQARQNYYACRQLLNDNKSTCLASAITVAYPMLKPVLELQNKFMNPAIEISSWKDGKLSKAVFNQFDYSTVPSNFVYIKKTEAIDLADLSETFTISTVSNNTLIKDSRYETETEFTFNDGNLVNAKGRDGINNSFIWGYNKSLPIVKVVGATYDDLSSAYTAVGGNISLIRNQPTVSKAFLSTYNHSPLMGLTSVANPNYRFTNYEYDKLFRLLRIRDHDNNILKQWQYQFYTPSCLPDWQNQGAIYCEALNGSNTGYQLQLQRDTRACSPTYNQTRIITIGFNPGACSITCSPANCSVQGYKCINGTCELGIKVYTSSVQSPPGQWTCTYHYEWSDGSWSGNYIETASYNCSGIIQ